MKSWDEAEEDCESVWDCICPCVGKVLTVTGIVGSWKGWKTCLLAGNGKYLRCGLGVWLWESIGRTTVFRCSDGGTDTER